MITLVTNQGMSVGGVGASSAAIDVLGVISLANRRISARESSLSARLVNDTNLV